MSVKDSRAWGKKRKKEIEAKTNERWEWEGVSSLSLLPSLSPTTEQNRTETHLTHLLIPLSNQIRNTLVVLQSREPELRDSLDSTRLLIVVLDLGNSSLLLVLVVGIGSLSSSDLLGGGLGLSRNDGGSSRVEGSVFGGELGEGRRAGRKVKEGEGRRELATRFLGGDWVGSGIERWKELYNELDFEALELKGVSCS